MKKATLIIWAIIFGVIALLIFQNQVFFLTNQSLRVNLGVIEAYHTPELPIAVTFLLFFLAGIIIAYLFNISARFKAKRTIKKLNATIASHDADMAGLKGEIDSLKGINPPAEGDTSASESDLVKTQKISSDGLEADPAGQTVSFSADMTGDKPTDKAAEASNEKKR